MALMRKTSQGEMMIIITKLYQLEDQVIKKMNIKIITNVEN